MIQKSELLLNTLFKYFMTDQPTDCQTDQPTDRRVLREFTLPIKRFKTEDVYFQVGKAQTSTRPYKVGT